MSIELIDNKYYIK